ncbi:MAG: hypothetical protein ACJA2M_001216 [Polaribacter sp.]|jgi:hypothetical protein
MTEILTDDWLDNFFAAADGQNILKRRESHCIEFKGKFDWSAEKARANYCKSLCAFSNNKGGALIFGVEDSPHKIVGIQDYEKTDDADITNYINELFTPSINFERKEFNFRGMTLGILYAFKNKNRPIICNKDSSKTNSSDIYYRYGAKSSKIKAGDLIKLIEDVKREESERWMKLLENIGEIGIENTHLLNSMSGEIISDNNTFLLDETLLSQIKIIDKYSIQKDGEPAVKIIGHIPELARVIKTNTNIYEEDIYKSYLNDISIATNEDLMKFICQKNTAYYPFYFLLRRLQLSEKESIKFLEDVKIRGTVRKSLIERIKKDKKSINYKNRFTLASNSQYGAERKKVLEQFIESTDIDINSEVSAKRVLEAVFRLETGEFDFSFVKKVLYYIFEEHYPFQNGSVNYLFRDAITYLDYIENKASR